MRYRTYRTPAQRRRIGVVDVLLAAGLIAALVVLLAPDAEAHHGDLTATTDCVDGDRVVTWSQGWANVPKKVVGLVTSRTGNEPVVDRGTTQGREGRIEWTVTYPGDTTTTPWEWAWIKFDNGHKIDSARRVEGLTPCQLPEPEPTETSSPDPSPTPTPTPTPTEEPSPSPAPSPSPSPEPTSEPSPTPTPTSEPEPEPTETPAPTPGPTDSPDATPTPSPSAPAPDPEPTCPGIESECDAGDRCAVLGGCDDDGTPHPDPIPDHTPKIDPLPEEGPGDDAPEPGEELAETGAELWTALAAVAIVLGLGVTLLYIGRRSRS